MQSHLCSRGFFPWNPLSSPFCCYNSMLLPQRPPAESFPQPSCNESLSLVFSWHLKKILKAFIFGCAGSLLLSLVAASGGSSGQASHCGGFSLQSAGSTGVGFSNSGSWAQELRLGSCGTQAPLLCTTWDPPGPGTEPASLTGRWILYH